MPQAPTDQRPTVTPQEFVKQFMAGANKTDDPNYNEARQTLWQINGYRQKRTLDAPELAVKILDFSPALANRINVTGLDEARTMVRAREQQLAGPLQPLQPPQPPQPPAPKQPVQGGFKGWAPGAQTQTQTQDASGKSEYSFPDVRRGAMEGVAGLADWGANLTELIRMSGIRSGGAYQPATAQPPSQVHDPLGKVASSLAGAARWERERAEKYLPAPTTLGGKIQEAIPHAIGVAAPYIFAPEAGAASLPARLAASGATMGTIEAIREADKGPEAMGTAAVQGAALGGVGFPLAEWGGSKILGPLLKWAPASVREPVVHAISV